MSATLKTIVRITLIFFVFSSSAFAITYTTLTNGAWNDVTTVWSTDGGFTACGCTPGAASAGNDININHNITTSYNLIFNGGSLISVNPSGTLSGADNLNMWNSRLDLFGNTTLNKFSMGVSSVVNIHTGVIVTFSNSLDVTDGILTNDGGLTHSGGITVGAAGTIILINSARMHVDTGNMTNHGLINIGAGCCMSSNGNWRNMANGTVIGFGAVNSGGNINNTGIWDLNVSWCANGAGIGLPNPQDCLTAQGICFAIVLPVELTDFTAIPVDNDYVILNWTTVSEANSDKFIIERSTDGENWEEISEINAAGNSTSVINYEYFDYRAISGDNYYRLIQVDIDGRRYNSPVTYASLTSNDELLVYPNPASAGTQITIQNILNGDKIYIRNSSGNIALEEIAYSISGSLKIDITNLQPGMYFINTDNSLKNTTTKLIITR